jgi:hypothetical protein
MQSRAANFRFIDLPTSAERLGITRNQLLQLVDEGRIKPFTGSGQQSVFRATDVDLLGQELGRAAQAAAEAEAGAAETEAESPASGARPRRRDPIKLIGTRLSMDSRWAEISDEDVATWVDALEPVQFERVRKVGSLAIERIQYVLAQIDEQERKIQARSSGSGR